ncbi:hypothetical protein QFC22_001762 [Naganishia vaughanmartiniae]|uniref:Uncharacterized protein n=1 Tax=Naganishia vaughanmartiniae TaxID=1424756 RepID=A0ACC2XG29_9TREE|nr:hypothetical protein QFC22_001762 [Naganishia vaughanmartiniae]
MADSRNLSQTRTLVAATAAIAIAVTAGSILGGQAVRRRLRTAELKRQVEEDLAGQPWKDTTALDKAEKENEAKNGVMVGTSYADHEKVWAKGEYDEELIREQTADEARLGLKLSRNYTFLGEEGMTKVRNSYVVVFDLTTLSSLNRHAAATLEDVGTPKVEATRKLFRKIAPWAQVETKVGLWRKGTESESWLEGADWVVDAIDNINTKIELLAHCHNNGLKVFSSMGAGAKCDPTRVQIADISNTYEDALARNVRIKLRRQGIHSGIPVVYSTEVPGDIKLLPLPDEEFEKGKVNELGAFDDFRVRILPVLGPLPSIFGLHAANYILMDLAGKPLEFPLPVKNRRKTYERLERDLASRETKMSDNIHQVKRIPISQDDIAYVFEDLHQGRSTLSPYPVLTKPALIRWYKNQPLTVWNCVVMSEKDADRHMKEVLQGEKTGAELWGEEAERLVQKRARDARAVWEWRS